MLKTELDEPVSVLSCGRAARTRVRTVALVFGTRPEAVKLCPMVEALRGHGLAVRVCVTGQHRDLLAPVLDVFGVAPDEDLALMRPDQSLADLTARAVPAIDAYLAAARPDAVLVQGDTTTAFAAALAAFYRRVPVGHVEAGLRTGRMDSPFPEEMNRVLISRLAAYHFAPTPGARRNLLAEGVALDRIFVTGNTGLDALRIAVEEIGRRPPEIPGLPADLGDARPVVLVTGHRRESFGPGLESICRAIDTLASRFPDAAFVYPVHPNPNVRGPVDRLLGGRRNVFLIEPLAYLPFVALMQRSRLVLTDSGGIQEEAPSLGKPVLVMRDTTERPEAVEAGTVRLVGADTDRIVDAATSLLLDPAAYAAMARAVNPYGDGHACGRIAAIIEESL
jgi:UDP-N-acetylglucosamine 2-epimerase (non-hydrolysing)